MISWRIRPTISFLGQFNGYPYGVLDGFGLGTAMADDEGGTYAKQGTAIFRCIHLFFTSVRGRFHKKGPQFGKDAALPLTAERMIP